MYQFRKVPKKCCELFGCNIIVIPEQITNTSTNIYIRNAIECGVINININKCVRRKNCPGKMVDPGKMCVN